MLGLFLHQYVSTLQYVLQPPLALDVTLDLAAAPALDALLAATTAFAVAAAPDLAGRGP